MLFANISLMYRRFIIHPVILDFLFLNKGGYDHYCCIFRIYFKFLGILSCKVYGTPVCSANAINKVFFTGMRDRERSKVTFYDRFMGLTFEFRPVSNYNDNLKVVFQNLLANPCYLSPQQMLKYAWDLQS